MRKIRIRKRIKSRRKRTRRIFCRLRDDFS